MSVRYMSQGALNSQLGNDLEIQVLPPSTTVIQISNNEDKPNEEGSELSNRELTTKRMKKREKIDLRKLKLKELLDIMIQKKISQINLKYEIFPSLIANERNFARCYNQNTLTQSLFDFSIITPYDHRMMATLLATKYPRQFILTNQCQDQDQEDHVIKFYDRIYEYPHFKYFKIFLELEKKYNRRTIKSLRNQYADLLCAKNSSYLTGEEKKEIQQLLKADQRNEQTLLEKMNSKRKKVKREEVPQQARKERIQELRKKVFAQIEEKQESELESTSVKQVEVQRQVSDHSFFLSDSERDREMSLAVESLFESNPLDISSFSSLNSDQLSEKWQPSDSFSPFDLSSRSVSSFSHSIRSYSQSFLDIELSDSNIGRNLSSIEYRKSENSGE